MLPGMSEPDELDAMRAEEAEWAAEWAEAEAAARTRLREELELQPAEATPAPAGVVPAAAGARELVAQRAWPLDWVARAAGDLPEGDAELLLALLEAVIAPTHPTGLGEDEALLLMLEPDDWVDVAILLGRGGAGTAATPQALAGVIEASDDLLEAAFELVVPVWQACGVVDLDQRLTRIGAWLVPRAVASGLSE